MAENLPLATIQAAVLEFLCDRDDAAIFGAQAVNAYADASRMTQDVDILTTHGESFSEELSAYLQRRFHIATRVRSVASGLGHRIYQVRTPANRHLVDVRHTNELPPCQRIEQVLVVAPAQLLAMKVISMAARPNTPKGLTDEADLLRLLLVFPEHKILNGAVTEALEAQKATALAVQIWQDLVAREILPDAEDEY